ncbi:hypothetical protein E4T56_gene19589 [Termitomyces sp. T112]|nr:hypothetical protein E4T56_gene19589 [Termitomyces sp. T112]
MGTATERLVQLQEVQAHLKQLEAQVGAEVWGALGGTSIGVPRAMAERARRQEEWHTNEAALEQQGADSALANWTRKHHILLDGALAVLGSIHDGLVRMPRDLFPELGQEVMQMGHLLARHWQRVMADPGAWWKVATDMGESLLEHSDILVMVVAQLEVDMVGRIAEVESEEEGE